MDNIAHLDHQPKEVDINVHLSAAQRSGQYCPLNPVASRCAYMPSFWSLKTKRKRQDEACVLILRPRLRASGGQRRKKDRLKGAKTKGYLTR